MYTLCTYANQTYLLTVHKHDQLCASIVIIYNDNYYTNNNLDILPI